MKIGSLAPMKTKVLLSLITLRSVLSGLVTADPLGTAFTYPGQLANGSPARTGFTISDLHRGRQQ